MVTRRHFLDSSLLLGASLPLTGTSAIQGFNEKMEGSLGAPWKPFSDQKVRVGIAGYGVCSFGGLFFFQNHPNVEVVAATDLNPTRCAELAQKVGAKRTYASCEEMLDQEGKRMDAVFIATDAPSHISLVLRALDRGYHVASAVPTLLGIEQLEQADVLMAQVKKTGLVYELFETTAYRPQAYAMRKIYEAGGFGKLFYTEGEYFHSREPGKPITPSYKGWREGLPPQYYPTHSNGFYTTVTHNYFTEVSCVGGSSDGRRDNRYNNPYDAEVAFYKTSDGGCARMTVAWGLRGYNAEAGRCFGTSGCYMYDRYVGNNALIKGVDLRKPQMPESIQNRGDHGGSHPYLTDDFIRSILLKKRPCVDVATALNTTVSGIYAHMSALKGGETLKIPHWDRI